jgi:hypothetical protein
VAWEKPQTTRKQVSDVKSARLEKQENHAKIVLPENTVVVLILLIHVKNVIKVNIPRKRGNPFAWTVKPGNMQMSQNKHPAKAVKVVHLQMKQSKQTANTALPDLTNRTYRKQHASLAFLVNFKIKQHKAPAKAAP